MQATFLVFSAFVTPVATIRQSSGCNAPLGSQSTLSYSRYPSPQGTPVMVDSPDYPGAWLYVYHRSRRSRAINNVPKKVLDASVYRGGSLPIYYVSLETRRLILLLDRSRYSMTRQNKFNKKMDTSGIEPDPSRTQQSRNVLSERDNQLHHVPL